MDFRPDNGSAPVKTTARFDWKILAGLIVVVIFIAYILIRFFVFVSGTASSAQEKALVSYYESVAKNDTNALAGLLTPDFTDETPARELVSGRHEIFAYSHEKTAPAIPPAGAATNASPAATEKILYSVSSEENGRRVSYLLEANFTRANGQVLLQSVRKVSAGRRIGK